MADEKRSFQPTVQSKPARIPAAADGVSDNPQEDWGEPADEGTTYSANHATRGEKTDAERGQGPKTRKASKDTISRRL